MASRELTIQCLQASSKLLLIRAEAKEYDADWLGSGQKVNRIGGRFAPKAPGEYTNTTKFSESALKDLEESGKTTGKVENIKQVAKDTELIIKQMDSALNGLTKEEQLRYDELLNNPNVAKGTEALYKGIEKTNPEMAEYFRKTREALLGGLDKKKTVKDVLKKAQLHLQDLGKIVGENPTEWAIAGAVFGTAVVVGGIGAVAFFSIPNLIGLGGVFGGISAIAQGATAAEIAQAFAVGGLSQVGFSTCLFAAINGAYAILQNIQFLEETRFQEIVTPIALDAGVKLDTEINRLGKQAEEEEKKAKKKTPAVKS